jgi:hypothetical protein
MKGGVTGVGNVASRLSGHSPRQRRERWFSYLVPDVNRTPWSSEEDGLLFDLLETHGPKWGSIVTFSVIEHKTTSRTDGIQS